MPLCAKCHQQEATVHFTFVTGGAENETVHLCQDCAPPTGLKNFDLKELAAMSVAGKRCEFCGQAAFSGVMRSRRDASYWCFECGAELMRILADLWVSEKPDLMQRGREKKSFLSFCSDPELQAWSEAVEQKAVQLLRERRRQDGRDQDV